MTRFARAKGSKSSNERVPEAATSWKTMKQDLQKNQAEATNKNEREKIIKERQKNYDNFVKELDDKVEKKWANFPLDASTIKKKAIKVAKKIARKDKIKKMKANLIANKQNAESDGDEAPEEVTAKVEPQKVKIRKAKDKKQALKIPSLKNKPTNFSKMDEQKKKFENKRKRNEPNEQKKKFENKRKLPKQRDNKEHKRRKPEVNTIKIGGQEEEIVYFQRFPVLKSDKEQLITLRKTLISRGVPKSEVDLTMKLERRKAEKRLARAKKVVCFHCRESGHMLSECAKLENKSESLVDSCATGICFKCGSTEHSHRECKVSRDYKYANCFICREQGHIASQCPDNPKGLYPKGGACKLCGDVTHLKKDCPKYQEQSRDDTLFLKTISSGNIESIDDIKETKIENDAKSKVIKF